MLKYRCHFIQGMGAKTIPFIASPLPQKEEWSKRPRTSTGNQELANCNTGCTPSHLTSAYSFYQLWIMLPFLPPLPVKDSCLYSTLMTENAMQVPSIILSISHT
ncbi:hypothetical protein KIL84_015591 [Mauremys mutica]|uniref:Uncharacterized protein n=1 Tax=Mauremys mutica TaxID=74926 RepID=A0A9D3WMI2_9SAUR|nr:hypothetical protein KIL84_015591 [Mauremys mutica]